MSKKIMKMFLASCLAFSVMTGFMNLSTIPVQAASTRQIVGPDEGVTGATLTGLSSFSTTRCESVRFNLKSTIVGTSGLELTVTVTNGYLRDIAKNVTVVDSGRNGGATKKTIKRAGANVTYEFYPYNYNVAGYTIVSYRSYY